MHLPIDQSVNDESVFSSPLNKSTLLETSVSKDKLPNQSKPYVWFMKGMQGLDNQGYRSYFHFVFWTILLNIVMFVVSMISFIYHSRTDDRSQFSDFEFLTLGSYGSDVYRVWIGTTLTIFTIWFIFSIWFVHNDTREQIEGSDYMENQLIEKNKDYEIPKRHRNIIISWCVVVLYVILSAFISYYIASGGEHTVRDSFAIAVITSALGFVWNYAAQYLTEFERQMTEAKSKKSYLRKLLAFRLLNVFALYTASGIAARNDPTCVLQMTGEQFFFILLTEIIFMTPLKLLIAHISPKILRIMYTHLSDSLSKPEFDVSFEYMEIFYRQFVILHGIAIFPMLSIMGALATCFEIVLDRYRFMSMTYHRPLQRSNEKEMLAYLFVLGVWGFLCYPFGPFWLISRPKITNYEGCSIFD